MTNSLVTRMGGAIAVLLVFAFAALARTATTHGGRAEGRTEVLGLELAASSNTNTSNGNTKVFGVAGSVSGLYPGATKTLLVTVTNPYSFDINVTSLTVAVGTAGDCLGTNLRSDDFHGSLIVSKNSTATQGITLRMRNDPPNTCRNARFPLTYGGTAEKA